MKDRLIKLLETDVECDKDGHGDCSMCEYKYADDKCAHYLSAIIADFFLASGVIVPPCKVGDTLWVRWSLSEGHKKDIYPVKVYALRFDTKKNNMRICVEGHFKITAYGGSYTHYYNGTFAWESIGKTVFLTKEEAEKVLAERSREC